MENDFPTYKTYEGFRFSQEVLETKESPHRAGRRDATTSWGLELDIYAGVQTVVQKHGGPDQSASRILKFFGGEYASGEPAVRRVSW